MRTHRIGLLSTRVHYFETVVRTGSVRRAALKLNVAPSAISRSIAQLEQDLGTALFERIRQRLKLTSAGEILIHHARITRAELNKAYDLIDDLKGLRRGIVNIAVVESVARGLLPEILAGFWLQFPEIVVEIRIMGSRQAFEAVLVGESDLALAFDDRESKNGLSQLAGISLDMGVLVPPNHPLGKRREVRMRDLVNERVLMSDCSLTLAASIEEAMQHAFATISPRSRTNSISVMTELTLHGCGIAFQTRVGVEKELAERQLVFLPLRDSRLRPRKLVLMERSHARLSHANVALKDMIVRGLDRLR
jgi:DNA-binding transcriptional LysR family regulator